MYDRRTHSNRHERSKGTVVGNYTPITCLPLMRTTVDKYILRSKVWTFEFPGISAK